MSPVHALLTAASSSQVHALLGEGSVIGIIPEALQPREVSGAAVGEVRIVPDMHTRKVGKSCGVPGEGKSEFCES